MSLNYLLATNIISEVWKDTPNSGVSDFLRRTPLAETFLSLFTLTELRYGIHLLEPGKRKQAPKGTKPLNPFARRPYLTLTTPVPSETAYTLLPSLCLAWYV